MSNTQLEQDIKTLQHRLTVMQGWLNGKVVYAKPKGGSTSPPGVYDPKALPESDIPWDWNRFDYSLENPRSNRIWLGYRGEDSMPDIFTSQEALDAAHAANPYQDIVVYNKGD